MQFVRDGKQLLNPVVLCNVAFESGCRSGVIVYSDEILHLLMCVVFVFENVELQQKFKHLCSLFLSSYSSWILSFDAL